MTPRFTSTLRRLAAGATLAVAGWPGLVSVTLPTVSPLTSAVVVKPVRAGVWP